MKSNLLRNYTTFRLGGQVRRVIDVKSAEKLPLVIKNLQNSGEPYFILGGGTNIIASDEGFAGAIVKISLKKIDIKKNKIVCQAGAGLSDLVNSANLAGLSGLETLAGIPGTVGGAIFGNAGAYGREISDSLKRVRIFDGKQIRGISKKSCGFAYRSSIFKKRPEWIILGAEFKLKKESAENLMRKSREIINLREKKYRPDIMCAGSIFKNILTASTAGRKLAGLIPPEKIIGGKIPAGYLLEQVGAKGMRVGGIYVASHHGNLIINNGRGKSSDAKRLIDVLKNKVKNRYGIELEEEIRYLGF